jgi:hypothetical protein
MQKLAVSSKDGSGQDSVKEVMVLRSWANASGAAVYLFHGTGIYGYMDGSPVKNETDLDIIDSPIQRNVAKKWWDARGRALSEAFYSEKEAAEQARNGDFQDDGATPDTELDYVMYQTRTIGKGKPGSWGQPFSWMDKFSVRPDWWGQARKIAFNDVEYSMVDAEEDVMVTPVVEKKIGAGEI